MDKNIFDVNATDLPLSLKKELNVHEYKMFENLSSNKNELIFLSPIGWVQARQRGLEWTIYTRAHHLDYLGTYQRLGVVLLAPGTGSYVEPKALFRLIWELLCNELSDDEYDAAYNIYNKS